MQCGFYRGIKLLEHAMKFMVERIFKHRIRQQIEVYDMELGFMKGKAVIDVIFTAQRSYASAVLGVAILSVCLSVSFTRAL